MKKVIIFGFGIIIGGILGYLLILNSPSLRTTHTPLDKLLHLKRTEVIGFLPYWLLSKAKSDYSPYITTLTYFGLTVETDGTIRKMNNPQETEPGFYVLDSGRADQFLNTARNKGQTLSLLVFNGDNEEIFQLISEPEKSAKNLVNDVKPIMQKHNFKDLNLDIESVAIASSEARLKFTEFVKTVNTEMDKDNLGTLTIDVTGDSVVKPRLINIPEVAPFVDYIVLMAYDYHYIGSSVTGAVAPLYGAGITAEYDIQAATEQLLKSVPKEKIILGVPLYGYEWESLRATPASAIIPSTGLTASTMRVEELLRNCATCSATETASAKESYVSFLDTLTNTIHQIFFPTKSSTQAKIDFMKQYELGGLALWALGYESSDVLEPLRNID